jgi:arylsulfatase A-like enzyme
MLKMRKYGLPLIFVLIVFFLSSCIGKTESVCPNCNVILVTIDALCADHLGLYGYSRDTSDTFERLSANSIVYGNVYAQSSWTRTSMASMLTGRYPAHHGVLTEKKESYLDDDFLTLPEVFKNNGYSTAGYVANANLKQEFGFSQGFDHYREGLGGWRTGAILKEVVEWIEPRKSQPFFIWMHLNEPHDPYTPPEGYDELYGKDSAELIRPLNTSREFMLAPPGDKELRINLTNADLARMVDLYDGEIKYVNDEFGVLMTKLSRMGLTDNTIIVVTADHGEEFQDHGRLFHGHSLYEELVRIPLLIYVPQVPAKRMPGPVELIDVYPTLCDLTGLSFEGNVDGVSLAEKDSKNIVYSETDFRTSSLSMVVDLDMKFIHDWKTGESILFDLKTDPGEKKPLSLTESEKQKYMDLIQNYRTNPYTPKGSAEVSEETTKQLKELGYII